MLVCNISIHQCFLRFFVSFTARRFKEKGKFLDDIWINSGAKISKRSDGSSLGLNVDHVAEALRGASRDGDYEDKLDVNDLIGSIHKIVKKADANGVIQNAADDTDSEDDSDDGSGKNRNESNFAVKHEDFLRSDRGKAAIDLGEEGCDEEMGGATQDAMAVYEHTKADLGDDDDDDDDGNSAVGAGSDVETQSIGNVDNDEDSDTGSKSSNNLKPDAPMSVDDQNDHNDVKPSAVSSDAAVPDAPVSSYGRPDDAERSSTILSIAPDTTHSETIADPRNIPAASSHTGDLSNDIEASKPSAKSTANTKTEKGSHHRRKPQQRLNQTRTTTLRWLEYKILTRQIQNFLFQTCSFHPTPKRRKRRRKSRHNNDFLACFSIMI